MRGRLSEYKSRVAAVYILGLFIQILDGTIVNIAIPTLADEFGVESTDVDWAIIGYALALAVTIPVSGWLGDRYGTKRMFLIALIGFVLASTACGAATSLEMLIAFRVVQGMFAGLITPIGSAMLFRAYPVEERAKAATLVIGVAVIAPAIGPVLGGILIDTLSWRWIFYVNIPVGTVGLVLGWLWLREEIVGASSRIDGWGILLSGGGLAMVLFAVSDGPSRGWGSPVVLTTLGLGVVALVVLVVVEQRVENPVLALRLYGDRLFRATNLTSAPAYAGFFSLIFLMPIFLQKVGDHSALVTGLTLLPQPIGVIISSQLVGRRLYSAIGPRGLLISGCLGALVPGLYLITVDESTSLGVIGAVLLVRGIAMGFVFVAIQTATYATISLPDMGRATALFNTQRQAAVAVGVALAATVLSATVISLDDVASGGSTIDDRVQAFRYAFGASAVLFGIAAVFALSIRNEDAAATMGRIDN
ncbi:MAG: DHA2 family efflux MFS transporter permease subunit [Acidimicrobiia bacterium]|nr:DHA2 family efflux MFS transporter permease subunit [Acidimicrobiia bacterium]